jgi:hypothetical protein
MTLPFHWKAGASLDFADSNFRPMAGLTTGSHDNRAEM